MSKSCSNK